MKQLEDIGDEKLSELLSNWKNIRLFQATGGGVRSDQQRIEHLFKLINDRLEEIGKPREKLHSMGELP